MANAEKKSLLVSINSGRNAANSGTGGYDSLNTVTTQMTLPITNTNAPAGLANTLLASSDKNSLTKRLKQKANNFYDESKKKICLFVRIHKIKW
jgi:hypothetical protein